MTTKLHYTSISDTRPVVYLEINFRAICKIEDLSFGEQRLETENFAQFSLQTDTSIFFVFYNYCSCHTVLGVHPPFILVP